MIVNLGMELVDCHECGIIFAITKAFYERRRADHANFFCPHGHKCAYTAKTEIEKNLDETNRLLETVRKQRDASDVEIARLKRAARTWKKPAAK
jgi:hypothetical protein